MAEPWLTIIGIGESGPADLGAAARAALQRAEIVFGGRRHLDLIGDHGGERIAWPRPLSDAIGQLRALAGQRVVVLASGDPNWFGIATLLRRSFDAAELCVIPHVSCFALAAARLGWAIEQTSCLSAHGRPVAAMARHLHPGARLLILTDDGAAPAAIADLLIARGYGASRLHVLEHLGGARERHVEAAARSLGAGPFADLNLVAVTSALDAGALSLSRVPGLPDDAFAHDGQITKSVVRAATLAALAPLPGALLWDVGAGSGSVAIEWLRATEGAAAVAIERKPGRIANIRANAARLGTPDLVIIEGTAPAALQDLPAPHAIFIGGGASAPRILETCWEALLPGGRLVANAVTLESEARLLAWADRPGAELRRIAISEAEPVGPYRGWRPLMPVTQLVLPKPPEGS